jgi:RimJ/RimL family protein N-acetyltransferase
VKIDLKRCCVRDLVPADAASLARHANNRQIWLNLRDRFPHPYTLEDARVFIANAMRQTPPTVWTIEAGGEAIGTIGIMLRSDIERVGAEIGYWIGETFWGRGIMTEAVRAVSDWALREFGLTRIYAFTSATNAASSRVLEKAGFQFEGRLRKSAIKDGQVLDQMLYAYVVAD